MANIIEKNKTFIFIGLGIIAAGLLIYYVIHKNNKLVNCIDNLKLRVDDLEDILQRLEKTKNTSML